MGPQDVTGGAYSPNSQFKLSYVVHQTGEFYGSGPSRRSCQTEGHALITLDDHEPVPIEAAGRDDNDSVRRRRISHEVPSLAMPDRHILTGQRME